MRIRGFWRALAKKSARNYFPRQLVPTTDAKASDSPCCLIDTRCANDDSQEMLASRARMHKITGHFIHPPIFNFGILPVAYSEFVAHCF